MGVKGSVLVVHPLQLLQSVSYIASSETTVAKNTAKSCKSIRSKNRVPSTHNVSTNLGSRKLKEMRAKRLGELEEALAKGSKLEL